MVREAEKFADSDRQRKVRKDKLVSVQYCCVYTCSCKARAVWYNCSYTGRDKFSLSELTERET